MAKVIFPVSLLEPIKQFLHLEERKLSKRKKDLDEQDPFNDRERVVDNAAVDTDASEQFGHATVEGLKREVDRKLIQVRKALTRIKLGKYGTCEKCGEMIDTDRLMVFPEATMCVKCEKKKEK
ncbi:MAG: TraR/DksA C4-type zinc finger protein [Patescibacteria group bacterium]|nr:TraR/DksA C4-type zinc finger protein [Patescibacteria group bacterium]